MKIEDFKYVEIKDLKTRDLLDLASNSGAFRTVSFDGIRHTVHIPLYETPDCVNLRRRSPDRFLRVGFDTFLRIRTDREVAWDGATSVNDVARLILTLYCSGALPMGAPADETPAEVVGATT